MSAWSISITDHNDYVAKYLSELHRKSSLCWRRVDGQQLPCYEILLPADDRSGRSGAAAKGRQRPIEFAVNTTPRAFLSHHADYEGRLAPTRYLALWRLTRAPL